jgi:hypothetical protein
MYDSSADRCRNATHICRGGVKIGLMKPLVALQALLLQMGSEQRSKGGYAQIDMVELGKILSGNIDL